MKKSLQLILVTGGLGTLIAMAADQPMPRGGVPGGDWGGGRTRAGDPGGRGNFQGPGRGGMAGLDDQQRQRFQEALQKDNDKLRGLEGELRAAQKDLLQAILSSNYDEKTVRSKAEAMARIQVEIIMVRAGALASVAPTMDAEQKQQMTESLSGIALLSAGGSGGPASGGPRRGFPNGGPGAFAPGGAPGDPFFGGGRDRPPRER